MSKYIKPPETCVWHSGPPPSIGWWPASCQKDSTILRWWNGKYWSEGVGDDANNEDAAFCAKIKQIDRKEVQWAERWWEKK